MSITMVAIFYIIILVPALLAVTLRNPIHSVLALILVFFDMSVLLFFLEVEFLALIFLIVYLGAIAVLFLFVVMMLDFTPSQRNSFLTLPEFLSFAAFVAGWSVVLYGFQTFFLPSFVPAEYFTSSARPFFRRVLFSDYTSAFNSLHNLEWLAQTMYTYNFVAFFLVGMVLLVALVGSIALTVYHSSATKRQRIAEQLEHSYSNSIKLKKIKKGRF